MAGLGGTVLNIVDWAKRQDPNGMTAQIINLLWQRNDFLDDMLLLESNGATFHRSTVLTGEPSVGFRQLNTGVVPSKSTTAQLDESMGIIETYSEIDVDICKLNGNTAEFRLSEAGPFLSAIRKLAAQTMFYGDTTVNPERWLGLAPRFNAIAAAPAYVNSMISAGGSGSDNTSIWLVGWGANSVHAVFPKGSAVGLLHEDKGQVTIDTGASNGIGTGRMEAYRDRWQWKLGLAIRDHRYVVRICNIDVSDSVAGSGTNPDYIKLMSRALDRIPDYATCSARFYMNRTVFEFLRVQALAKSNAALAVEPALGQFGTPQGGGMSFSGIPIRLVDQILNTEATIS